MSNTLCIMNNFYAQALGCTPAALEADGVTIVPNEDMDIRIAKGIPLALYAIIQPWGTVIAVKPELSDQLSQLIQKLHAVTFTNEVCDELVRELTPLLHTPDWFIGCRLFCEASSFIDRSFGNVHAVTHEDPYAIELNHKWGGKVFGQIVDNRVVSWAAVKHISDITWDLRVDTLPEYQGKGYAKSVVSAAVKHIFDNGKLAGWGTDRTNTGSLRTANAVGFQTYSLDIGCIATIRSV